MTKADVQDALMRLSDIDDPEFRLQVLREMGDQLGLGGSFSAAYHPMARDHVFAIVNSIWAYQAPGKARIALASAVDRLRPYDAATQRLRELA